MGVGVLRHMQRYFSRIRNGIGSLTCPSYTDTGPPFLYGDSDAPPHLNAFYDTLGIRRTYSRLIPRCPHGGWNVGQEYKIDHNERSCNTENIRRMWSVCLKWFNRVQHFAWILISYGNITQILYFMGIICIAIAHMSYFKLFTKIWECDMSYNEI